VTERRDVVCGLFYILCLCAYLRGYEPHRAEASQFRWRWLARVFCLLALLGKATAVSLPVVLLILDIYPLARLKGPIGSWWKRPQRSVILEKSGYLLFCLLAIGIGLWGQGRSGIQSLEEVGLADRAALVGHAVTFYLIKTILPAGLSPMYPRPDSMEWLSFQFLGSCLAVVGISIVLYLLRRRWPAGLAAWACYVVALLPVSGLLAIGHELAADRYSYLPSLFLAVLLGCVATWALQRLRTQGARMGFAAAAAMVTICYAGATRGLMPIWRSDVTLWKRAVAISPSSARALTNLGGARVLAGEFAEARPVLREAVRLDPNSAKAHYNLGIVSCKLGRFDGALAEFAAAIQLDPDHLKAREGRARALIELDRAEDAIRELQEAPDVVRTSAPLQRCLAEAYAKRQDDDPAIAIYKGLLADGSQYSGDYAGLADLYTRRGQVDEAESVLMHVVPEIAGTRPVRYAMLRLRAKQRRITEALAVLRDALLTWPDLRAKVRLDPMLVDLRRDDRFDQAMAEVESELVARRARGSMSP
ncbi:MAG: tetratricopeptide repeat protein, partial [Phycisphaerae bacterium]|nr:tetratricopeptide repeat protein [Phycisphaerae bacterium]